MASSASMRLLGNKYSCFWWCCVIVFMVLVILLTKRNDPRTKVYMTGNGNTTTVVLNNSTGQPGIIFKPLKQNSTIILGEEDKPPVSIPHNRFRVGDSKSGGQVRSPIIPV